jgi:hypothetical protein
VLHRYLAVSCLFLAAIGIAVARGRKEEPAPAPPPVVEAPPPEAPRPPRLFPDGLPVALAALPPGLASLSAQSCNACHYAAHDTWVGSRHAQAWASPSYQAALRSAGSSTACLQCHLPLTNQHVELAAGYVEGDLTRPRLQPNPSFDLTLRAEGVTCAACHVRGDTVLGTTASTNAPHPVTASDELRSPELCASCHQLSWPGSDRPFYDTYGEWQGSAWAKAGVTCQDCHMAPASGAGVPGTNGTLPSHGFLADAGRALSVLVTIPGGSVQRGTPVRVGLTVQNTGAGLSFPTGNPFKVAVIDVVLVDAAGKDLGPAWSTKFARSVDAVPPWKTLEDTRLAASGQWSGEKELTPSVKGTAGVGAVEVRLTVGAEKRVLRRMAVEVR